MTNEEARQIIISEKTSLNANPIITVFDCLNEAYDVAIDVLGRQPCEDCISRADVKKYLSAPDANGDRVIYESDLDLLPSVTPDVLDKIRERISLEKIGYPPSAGYYKAIVKVLQIIDQYKAESEEEE